MVQAHWENKTLIAKVPQWGFTFEKKNQTTFVTYNMKDAQFNYEQLKGDLHRNGLVYPKGFCPGCKPDSDDPHTCVAFPAFE